MPHRIEVGVKPGFRDARGDAVREQIREDLGIEVADVGVFDVYTVDDCIGAEAERAAAQAALEDVARQCKLQLEPDGEKKWRLTAPNSENAAVKTITYASE